jgi:predicted Zn-ribbon and HTH transcriptional regulator
MGFFDRLFGKKPRGKHPPIKEQVKNIILRKCKFLEDLRNFFDETSPEFLKTFWSLSRSEQQQVLQEVLIEMHPDATENDIKEISKEILEGIPFIYDANKCSSCGRKFYKRSIRYSSKCTHCGRVYCQLCIMNSVDTPGGMKCVCNGDLEPYGMNWDEL